MKIIYGVISLLTQILVIKESRPTGFDELNMI